MAQPKIEAFGTFTEPLLHSPGECEFHMEGGVWIGTCQHYSKRRAPPKEPCRHVMKHLLNQMKQCQQWLSFKSSWKSQAEFTCFEDALESLVMYKSEEMSFISQIILSIAYGRGTVNGDDIYNIWGEPSKPQVMSATWSGLIRKGMIKRIGTRCSERLTTHGSDQGIYILTDLGMQTMQNLQKV